MSKDSLSIACLQELYARMLMARTIDDYAWRLHKEGLISFIASCHGHEAAQVGSAACIEVGKDFTLPYFRDLGVVLTLGMTPYEVFQAYLLTYQHSASSTYERPAISEQPHAMLHWGYQKHNTVTDAVPSATQALHAAGIAFACKLRKEPVVTVTYCSDGAMNETDFFEAIQFSVQHQLPIVFVCEQECGGSEETQRPDFRALSQENALTCRRVDGGDIIAVYHAMDQAMQRVRAGHGPVLLELCITRLQPSVHEQGCRVEESPIYGEENAASDPLLRCKQSMQEQGGWDEEWAQQLNKRIRQEVEQALNDALGNSLSVISGSGREVIR